MIVNNFFAALLIFGLVTFYFKISLARPSLSDDTARKDSNGGDYVISELNQERPSSSQLSPMQTSLKLASTTSELSSSLLLTEYLPERISAKPTTSLRPTFVYKAVVPTQIQPKLNNIDNYLELSKPSSTTRSSGTSMEKDHELSKKAIDSSVITSVSVILNGNEPEFANALGQKVAKPQPSLQVASPIDLLNPDRYEFYTFDENGELIKRLMTMEEIQSIVANGDGEGPTIIHHGPIEDSDPEKNVQDIVNSVQSVLNKKVLSNENTSTEISPVFDTPDVSSAWSMILPTIFGNTGSVNVFSHLKPQQIVMVPESEIIETSTKKLILTTPKNAKPSKTKPGKKRKSTTTTTEMVPQVIQEELDSKESVYTGMQQYQNLAAAVKNYDGFLQLQVQPIYYKLPEIEVSTRRKLINNPEVNKTPITSPINEEATVISSTNPESATATSEQTTFRIPEQSTITAESTITEVAPPISLTTTSTVPPPSIVSLKAPKIKKKKPTRNRTNSTTITPDASTDKRHLTTEKRNPSSHSHRRKPTPTRQNVHLKPTPNNTSSSNSEIVSSTRVMLLPIGNQIDTTTKLQGYSENWKTLHGYEGSFLPTKPSIVQHDYTSYPKIAATPGTSGYPVPSHDLSTDEPEGVNFYNKNRLSSHGNKPNKSDLNTLQSHGQTVQTSNAIIEHFSEKMSSEVIKSSSTLSPLHYQPEYDITSPGFKDVETTNDFSNLEKNSVDDKLTVRPNDIFSTELPEDVVTNIPMDHNTHHTHFHNLVQSADVTKEPFYFTEYLENQSEQTLENHTQKPEALSNTTLTNFAEPFTIENQPEMDTQLPNFFSQEAVSITDHTEHLNKPVLEDNAKSQLNLEAIKPAEQINLLNLQTQPTTVAATLTDSDTTAPVDYSSKTNNEIALLLSNVIHQISEDNRDVSKQITNHTVNLFSNQTQLDSSLIMTPSKDESQFITSTAFSFSDNLSTNQPNYEPIYERFHNQTDQQFDGSTASKPHVTTTAPAATTLKEAQGQDFYTQLNELLIERYNKSEHDMVNETNTVLDGKSPAMNGLISTTLNTNYQQQKLESDTDRFYEADSSKKTTTLFDGPFEGTTILDRQEISSRVEENEIENSIEELNTTPIAVTETSKENLAPDNTESATGIVETEEVSGYPPVGNVQTTEKYLLRTDAVGTESYRIPNITETSNRGEETTVQSMAPKGSGMEIPIERSETETSAELNAIVSEEDETDKSPGEDSYIKLGETTTPKSSISTSALQQGTVMPSRPDLVQTLHEMNTPTGTQSSLLIANQNEQYEESDQEDEEDQFGRYASKHSNLVSTTTSNEATTEETTTHKPKATTTTRRLSTLKPVSYFYKQPGYDLYRKPAQPLYNKHASHSSNTQQKEITASELVPFSTPTAQQRPIHRPPQLSNSIISSTQSARPAVKLEPSIPNSKGFEASSATLNKDVLAFATLCNELAFSYWKSITSEKISTARSLVISPFALTSMLSMIFLGARGSTSGEMNDILKLDDMVTFNPHLVFKNITDTVEKSMDKEIATTAFVREMYSDRVNGKVLQFFKEKAQHLYAGHVEEVNFHVVNDIIRRRTNLLVKRHTMGKVLEYLRTNSVWVNGPLSTVAANLFQTDCSHGSTQDRDGILFYQVHPTVRQKRLVPIPAVLFKSGFTAGYEANLDATVVAFGRIHDTTSVIYVMPGSPSSISPSDNLDRLEKQLMETAISGNAWSNLLTSLVDRADLEVQIPRFSHRSFVNTTTGLQSMGLRRLFKSDYADLGGLTGSSNRDIYLSDMIQINTFSTCGEQKIADHHHVELYPAPPLRKRNKDVGPYTSDDPDSFEAATDDFGSIVQDTVVGRGFYDDLLDPKYVELPLPLRPRQARVPEASRIRFDKPFLYFVRHNPSGMILFMGRFNPRLLP